MFDEAALHDIQDREEHIVALGMQRHELQILVDGIEDDRLFVFLANYLDQSLHGVRAHVVAGPLHQVGTQRLQDLKSLFNADSSDKLLTKIVTVRVRHQRTELVFYSINDHVKITELGFLKEFLHHS